MMNIVSDIPLIQQIVKSCKFYNLRHIVISPGSRNAPLTLSFSNDPFFTCYSIVDERCAAFFALGIAQQTNSPVALVCTSGSALLNYYPAISEAFYSDIPLAILSADRPKEKVDIGDGQTIRQEHVFKNHICFEANLQNEKKYTPKISAFNEQAVSEALLTAIQSQGPVHINIPLYEPLYNTKNADITVDTNFIPEKSNTNFVLKPSVKKHWANSVKKMVLVGVLPPNTIKSEVLDELLNDPSVLFLTETTSNLHHTKIIPNIDQLIAGLTLEEKEALKPEVLLTFGGLIVSKKIKFLLREFTPTYHYHISSKTAYDTFGCLTEHLKVAPDLGLKQFAVLEKKVSSSYQSQWLAYHSKLKIGHQKYVEQIPYSDFFVFHQILSRCDFPLQLQLSNSSTIRYTQLFQLSQKVEVFCNRGTSGIDGSTSTAIGAALVKNKPTILITGDLSFFYDSNALWNNYIPENFKIIVINNNGGGIFRILPGDKETENFETYLETTHSLKANHLAKMFNFDYIEADCDNLLNKLDLFFKAKSKTILEITTPRRVNDVVLLNYFEKIRE